MEADGHADRESPQQWLRLIQSEDSDPLEVLRTVGTYQRYLTAIEERAVFAARRLGRSWDEIAAARGVRRQSAWAKYQPKLHAMAEVGRLEGRWARPLRIALRCPRCDASVVLALARREGAVFAVPEGGDAEYRLPGPVRSRCAACGHEHEAHVELPGWLGES